jgi:hypothetical protein
MVELTTVDAVLDKELFSWKFLPYRLKWKLSLVNFNLNKSVRDRWLTLL